MNERLKELAELASKKPMGKSWCYATPAEFEKNFAQLIVQECVNTLEFHGFDDAIPYIKWMATNQLGVKNE